MTATYDKTRRPDPRSELVHASPCGRTTALKGKQQLNPLQGRADGNSPYLQSNWVICACSPASEFQTLPMVGIEIS
ncbi:hypothetical protein [Mycobacterium sp. 1164966.3]|uniref:hypothetical protein n=1 Tax=Mycobacterium sp. 1164966.3 TaxID=1856861 RepID=UPI0012E74443|nr:hypothetical protein [Mycobacterium sp. 1164966.3]